MIRMIDDDDFFVWLTGKERLTLFLAGRILSEIFAITNLRHAASRFWICTEPQVVITTAPRCHKLCNKLFSRIVPSIILNGPELPKINKLGVKFCHVINVCKKLRYRCSLGGSLPFLRQLGWVKIKKLIDFTIQDIIYTYFCLHAVVSELKVQICAALFSSAVPMLIKGTIYGYKSLKVH